MTQYESHSDRNRFATIAVGSAETETHPHRGGTNDIVPPVHLSATFEWGSGENANEHDYSRESNPTREALEEQLARLEGGEHALAFASGMAATSTTMLSLVPPGGHVVSSDTIYSGSEKLLTEHMAGHLDVDIDFVDARDPDNVADAVNADTDLIWAETPSNPLIRLCDIQTIADIAVDHDTLFGVDSTFASPYYQAPLELGADVVVHSTTKYLNGHSDSIGGAVITDDDEVFEQLAFAQRVGLGNMLSPFDCYLVARGIKTLPARMEHHEKNAMEVARFLESHDQVARVYYPGLESHPQHELASEQMSGYSGMLSFEFDGALIELEAFIEGLEVFTPGASLGGVESLVEVPSLMLPDEFSRSADSAEIPETLVRVSVGLEDADDLCKDLRTALP
ncbi:aminotransferase class I/II-fold pyridoxal phosphate-dependent enzyme [Haloarcula hispanica]|uniref:Aminotransferase class I/II-fold pyridoxal phosphate-dependent enzyme n=1 Tax=Haloarcula hispanica TaxID=51589 RepID=A0A482TDQ9_HALHI|nr:MULTISPECIES: aminotransferase class I/II-fold pyridoxal phosphate-dependent enzyme [Haloarcula]KZX49700.1 cystathionine beta-lyase [Haloarcula sp. K1]MCJ0619775.1 aminotransferase class I/II-fold pyridoxal phosphate-dependent enzyme [Haloarcula hispanica]RYJ10229.1 aminotransferase class I/II-fold pyridoxal phosphate-dependent enzyme [Haloarcula hispanica]